MIFHSIFHFKNYQKILNNKNLNKKTKMATNDKKTKMATTDTKSSLKLGKTSSEQSSSEQFSKPQAKPSNTQKVESFENLVSHLNNAERLTYELERFGQHFTVEEGDRWTQAEVDEEWARLHPPSSSPRSLAFVLNWDFKPASPPKVEYIVLDDNDDAQTPVPSPVQVPAISNSSMPVAKETPVNYWDDWRAREAKEAERLLKKRKSEDDWGKFLF